MSFTSVEGKVFVDWNGWAVYQLLPVDTHSQHHDDRAQEAREGDTIWEARDGGQRRQYVAQCGTIRRGQIRVNKVTTTIVNLLDAVFRAEVEAFLGVTEKLQKACTAENDVEKVERTRRVNSSTLRRRIGRSALDSGWPSEPLQRGLGTRRRTPSSIERRATHGQAHMTVFCILRQVGHSMIRGGPHC